MPVALPGIDITSPIVRGSRENPGQAAALAQGHEYIDEDVAEDAAEPAREASRDLPMADRLATLLHDVADSAPEVDADALDEGDWVEDQLAISDVEPGGLVRGRRWADRRAAQGQ